MGSVGSRDQSCIISTIMKFFIVSALVAAVSAEAQYFGGYPYSGLVGGYPYTSAYGAYPYTAGYNLAGVVPFGSSSGLDALTQGLDPVTQGYSYYGKRSAEAEPEAEAQILTTYAGLGYAGLTAYNGLYGLGAYSGAYNLGYAGPVSALNYGAYGLGSYYGKRSADAEPEADAQVVATSYAGLGYAGLTAYNGLYGLGAYNVLGAYNGLTAYNGLGAYNLG